MSAGKSRQALLTEEDSVRAIEAGRPSVELDDGLVSTDERRQSGGEQGEGKTLHPDEERSVCRPTTMDPGSGACADDQNDRWRRWWHRGTIAGTQR